MSKHSIDIGHDTRVESSGTLVYDTENYSVYNAINNYIVDHFYPYQVINYNKH
jgi:hypothetical protein